MNAGPLTACSHVVAQADHDWHTRQAHLLVQTAKLIHSRFSALELLTTVPKGPILCLFSSWFTAQQPPKIIYPLKLHRSP